MVKLVLLVCALSLLMAGSAARSEIAKCLDPEVRERVRGIMFDGIDDALKKSTMDTFSVWVRDPSDQPRRGIEGMRLAISAYIRARAAAVRWDPPRCGEE